MISFLVTLFFFFFAVQASPLSLLQRDTLDVFVPKIKSPNADTVWVIGDTVTVEWETSNAPKKISNAASVQLCDYPVLLAQGFDLRAGQVNVTVPSVAPGLHYITLFGDSGDKSKSFQIKSP